MKESYTLQFWILLFLVSGNHLFAADFTHLPEDPYLAEKVVTVPLDTFPLTDRYDNSVFDENYNPFDLKDPSAIEKTIEYDPESGQYIIYEKIGQENYRPPTYMTFDEYMEYSEKEQQSDYFSKLSGVSNGRTGVEATDPIAKLDIQNSLIDRLFGGTEVKITPQGNINLTFGVDQQRVDNPILTERQRRNGGFDFDLAIQMSVQGKIGEKLNLNTNYNTQATFDFENQLKLAYDSDAFSEDEIIKRIEAGNVRLPLRTNLIEGSESLFGILTELQFGKLWLTMVASQQKSQREQLQIQGGSELQEFEVFADNYDENRHFFLSQYNRDHFEGALEKLPRINSLFRVTRMEVWITNDRNATEGGVRDIVGLADLGETDILHNPERINVPAMPFARDLNGDALPANGSNDLYSRVLAIPSTRTLNNAVSTLQGGAFQLSQAKDFEKVRARLLSPSEYTFHPELGFVSLNVNLRPDQILGVSYQYTYKGEVYTVGELSNDVPTGADTLGVLFVKLLKSTTQRVDLPTWDLMMKNIYGIGAFQVGREDFKLDVFYDDPGAGEKRFLPEGDLSGTPLIRVFNLDNLNSQGDLPRDGVFDFVPGLTIDTRSGRVMFPILEPFGSSLASQLNDADLEQKYVYQQLYDSTLTQAREFTELNRFKIAGSFKSSVSSEISLGAFNLPEGSVTVTAGGRELQEDVDYEVDYNIGRIKILNDAILNSGTPVNVSFENNSLFGFQNRTMLGARADYRFNEDFSIGGTYMHLFERPFTQKVNIGDDPINNRIFGLDVSLDKDAPWLTKFVDGIPLIDTKEPSRINFVAEGAYLKPGHSRAINLGSSEGETEEEREDRLGGSVYLDDFEGSTSSFDLRQPANQWFIASVPQNDDANNNPMFPEAAIIDSTVSGVNRALINWYRIDPTADCADNSPSDSYCTTISLSEIFPNRNIAPGQNSTAQTFNLSYYPNERGPYNFDLPGTGTDFSSGIANSGFLNRPDTRWGGIMRALNQNNFEAANIEYLEFWMLSPFIPDANGAVSSNGRMFIEFGNISEDILRDSRLAFENGLPTPNDRNQTRVDNTAWGRIPRAPIVVNAFDNEPSSRTAQDIGLDGLDDQAERQKFAPIIDQYRNAGMNADALAAIEDDPSNDNFRFFGNQESIDRANATGQQVRIYEKFNNQEGNSMANNAGGLPELGGRLQSSTNIPDSEDLNRDNTLNETESYFQYEVPINSDGGTGIALNDFIADVRTGENGRTWYRYLIPLNEFTGRVGGIQNFRSIRFMRMYLKDFTTPVNLRFARLELVRNQWRRYQRNLIGNGINTGQEPGNTEFVVNSVNIEENSEKLPFNYVIPRGIQREQSLGAFPQVLQNEQSLSLNVCNLQDGDARAIYRNINFDMRFYEKIKMFVHAEDVQDVDEGDLSFFMRIGSDYEENYYEYEIPLTLSDVNAIGTDPGADQYINEVWREENAINFVLKDLIDLKVERNAIAGLPITNIHEKDIPNPVDPNIMNTIRIKGNPNLGLVKGLMLGVRNRDNNGGPVCAEVWVNELRLNGLDESAGGAAVARLDMQLADFGNVSLATEYRSNGWRRLEEKIQQTQREETISFDATTSLELSKFFPEKWGFKIPFYASISETRKNPEYDPYDLDILLKEKLSRTAPEKRDSVRQQAQDVSSIKTYNFTNVRKERTSEAPPLPFDISNFAFTYAKTITENSNPLIERDRIEQTRGAVTYNYSMKPLYISPFKKLIKGEKLGKHLGLIKDANINLIPNTFSFNTSIDRTRAETKYRFAGDKEFLSTFLDKRFTWDRNYTLQWNITKALDFSFNANNLSIVDELSEFVEDEGSSRFGDRRSRSELNDVLVDNLQDLGRNKAYSHNANVSYTLPFKSIPLLDWVNVRLQYGASYAWDAAALNATELGNIIQNSQNRQGSVDLNFESLYNKSKYLKKINDGNKKTSARSGRGSSRLQNSSRDKQDADDKKKKTKKENDRTPSVAEKVLIRPFMMIRRGRLNYQENFNTVLPGYLPGTQYLGLEDGFSAPGWDFVAGLQPDQQWIDEAGEQGWITGACLQNHEITQTRTQNFTANLTVEPFKNFRIEFEANRNVVRNNSELFLQDETTGEFEHLTPRENGSFTTTYNALNTLFGGNDQEDYQALFDTFLDNREIISGRLGTGVHDRDSTIFTDGFGQENIDVLIPSFLAAYTGEDANDIEVGFENQLKTLPRLNWRVNYRGLEKIPAFENVFKSFTLNHSYRSSLSINSFNTDLDYDANNPFQKNGITQNFYSRFEVPAITISEQFSPLIGVDMQFDNELSIRMDYSRARDLRMNFSDFQMSETHTSEYTVGLSYVAKDVIIGFLKGGAKKQKARAKDKDKDDDDEAPTNANVDTPLNFSGGNDPSDLTFTFDFSYRDDLTGNIMFGEDNEFIVTRGLTSWRVSPSVDYDVNDNLNLRLFFDYSFTNPKISNSFPITSSQGGVAVQFTLN